MKSTSFVRLAAAFGMAAVLCPPLATAQPPEDGGQRERGRFGQRGDRGPRDGRRGPFGRGERGGADITAVGLLAIDRVRDELKLDDVQAATIDAAIESYREERRDARPDRRGFRNLSDEEREARRAEQQKLAAKADEVIAVLLQPEQNARLKELTLQLKMKVDPIGMLKSEEMKSALSISEDQIAKIKAVEEDMRAEREQMMQSIRDSFSSGSGERPDFGQIRERMQKLSQKFSEQAVAVLTEDQSSQLQDRQGVALEIDLRSIMD